MTAFTALTVHATGSPALHKVLGMFGKGIEGSSTLNFGNSGGKNCDTGCPHHPKSGGHCYAVRAEIRPDLIELAKKLARHEVTDPVDLVVKAIEEIKRRRKVIPWLRVSAFGSVPSPEEVTLKFVSVMIRQMARDVQYLLETLEGANVVIRRRLKSIRRVGPAP